MNVLDTKGNVYLATTLIGKGASVEINSVSSRYIGILIEGAKEYGLPDKYIHELEQKNTVYVPGIS